MQTQRSVENHGALNFHEDFADSQSTSDAQTAPGSIFTDPQASGIEQGLPKPTQDDLHILPNGQNDTAVTSVATDGEVGPTSAESGPSDGEHIVPELGQSKQSNDEMIIITILVNTICRCVCIL